MNVEILHDRNPDFPCQIRVWINGEEVHDFVILDVDPGAGYSRADWDETTADVMTSVGLSQPLKDAYLAARTEAAESPYVDGAS